MLNSFHILPTMLLWVIFSLISFMDLDTACAQKSDFEPVTVELTSEERAWLEAHPDIRLGYTDTLEPEVIANPDGTYSGMVVDFLDALNERIGTHIGLRIYSIPELLDNAKKKSVDGILNLHPEYADSLGLIKTRTYWPAYLAVFAHKKLSFESHDDFANKRVAIIDKVHITQKFMDRHGKQSTILKVDDALEGLRSLQNGTADLFLGFSYNSFFIPKYQLLDIVPAHVFMDSPEWFGIGTRADWPVLVSILNKGIASFSKQEIHAIISKWSYLPEKKDTVEFTSEEKAWLAKNHTVRVHQAKHAPYLYSKDGKPVGIAADLINAVSKRTGIKFDFTVISSPFSAAFKGLIQKQGPDVIASLTPTPEREKVILFTKPYVSSPKFIFTRDDAALVPSMISLSGKTVAVVKDFLVHKELANNYPAIHLLIYKNNEEALRAISSGKAFAFIGSILSTPIMINKFGLKNLKASAPSALQDATVAMGIRNDWPELRDIINKVFDAIPESEKAALINKWSAVKIEYGTSPTDILKWVLLVAGLASGIVLLFIFWNRSLTKQVKERTIELKRSNESLEAEINEREQAEERLQEYQQRLKALAFQLTVTEEEERRRIAADLHDLIGHSLALARIKLAAIPGASDKTETAIPVAEISKILLKAVQDTKHLMFELSSPSLNELGLGAAIPEWLDEQIPKWHHLKTEFIDDSADGYRKTLDENIRAIMFRNVRELVTNVVKHAGANKVVVHLTKDANMVKIVVEDDGIGFDPDIVNAKKERKGGFGLFSIQERITDLAGSFYIQSEPGKGCRVTLTVPVGKRALKVE